MSGQTPLEVGPKALETGPGVRHVRSIGQVRWELLESGQSSLEVGPWVRQVWYPSLEASGGFLESSGFIGQVW
jgi:hypothetical protein